MQRGLEEFAQGRDGGVGVAAAGRRDPARDRHRQDGAGEPRDPVGLVGRAGGERLGFGEQRVGLLPLLVSGLIFGAALLGQGYQFGQARVGQNVRAGGGCERRVRGPIAVRDVVFDGGGVADRRGPDVSEHLPQPGFRRLDLRAADIQVHPRIGEFLRLADQRFDPGQQLGRGTGIRRGQAARQPRRLPTGPGLLALPVEFAELDVQRRQRLLAGRHRDFQPDPVGLPLGFPAHPVGQGVGQPDRFVEGRARLGGQDLVPQLKPGRVPRGSGPGQVRLARRRIPGQDRGQVAPAVGRRPGGLLPPPVEIARLALDLREPLLDRGDLFARGHRNGRPVRDRVRQAVFVPQGAYGPFQPGDLFGLVRSHRQKFRRPRAGQHRAQRVGPLPRGTAPARRTADRRRTVRARRPIGAEQCPGLLPGFVSPLTLVRGLFLGLLHRLAVRVQPLDLRRRAEHPLVHDQFGQLGRHGLALGGGPLGVEP